MNVYTFIFGLVVLGVLAFVVYLASLGNVAAIATLVILLSILLALLIVGAAVAITRVQADQEQRRFMANARERFQIISQTQELINQQNSQLWRQAAQQARLPEPKSDSDGSIIIDDSLFADFEE